VPTKPEAEPTATAPRSRKGAATRARLLDAAQEEFEATGFLDARISDIAERAGLSHGSFYHYFESKEQVFREVAEAHGARLIAPDANPEPRVTTDQPELERIRRANRRFLQRYRENAPIMGVIEEVSRYNEHVNAAKIERQKHFAEQTETAIRRLQEQGVADTNVDPEIAAFALGSMIGRFAELWLVEKWADYDFDAAADQLTLLWANAIGLDESAVE
jgi:AcrR family transcriptional regulator